MVIAACSSKRAAKKDDPAVASSRDAVGSDAPAPADAAVDAPPKKTFVTGAGRCGECHVKMYDEWEVSGHAMAATSDLYRATRAAANDPACDRCHAPLAAAIGTDPVATEGVTCDVCHTLREPAPSTAGAGFRLAIDDMVKYGPRCDLKDHYFHRMGCSPEHEQAAICGACHWWEPKGVPVYTEFKEWRDGPAAARGDVCQSCHMPKEKAQIAEGSPLRDGVPHHGLLGLATDLRKRAVALEATARAGEGAILVDVSITNATAGHYIPAGQPERRLAVHVRTPDHDEVVRIGRVLGDASGAVVPFWRATRVVEDTRIAPDATWQHQFTVPAGTKAAEIQVVYEALDPDIARMIDAPAVEPVVLVTAKLPLASLPRTVKVKPAAAGKRPKKKGTR